MVKQSKWVGLLISAASRQAPGIAIAQENPETARAVGLEEVVVTAQKRSASLQDTPLAVSAVTADTISRDKQSLAA